MNRHDNGKIQDILRTMSTKREKVTLPHDSKALASIAMLRGSL